MEEKEEEEEEYSDPFDHEQKAHVVRRTNIYSPYRKLNQIRKMDRRLLFKIRIEKDDRALEKEEEEETSLRRKISATSIRSIKCILKCAQHILRTRLLRPAILFFLI